MGMRRGVGVLLIDRDRLADFGIVVLDRLGPGDGLRQVEHHVVGPSRCNCFSSNRQVQKASGRAPTWP